MAIKKATLKIIIFCLAMAGFFSGLFSKILFGSSTNLGKLESGSNNLFSKDASENLFPTAKADYSSGSCSTDVNEDASADSACCGGDDACD